MGLAGVLCETASPKGELAKSRASGVFAVANMELMAVERIDFGKDRFTHMRDQDDCDINFVWRGKLLC